MIGNIRVSNSVHKMMIERVLHAPINLFYDITPTGTILNRFSKDLNIIDSEVGLTFGSTLVMVYQLLAVMIVMVLSIW